MAKTKTKTKTKTNSNPFATTTRQKPYYTRKERWKLVCDENKKVELYLPYELFRTREVLDLIYLVTKCKQVEYLSCDKRIVKVHEVSLEFEDVCYMDLSVVGSDRYERSRKLEIVVDGTKKKTYSVRPYKDWAVGYRKYRDRVDVPRDHKRRKNK